MTIHNILSKIIFLTFLSIASVFTSCKDDDDKDPETVDTNEIVGRWELESATPETAGTSIPALALIPIAAPCAFDLKFTFLSNNTLTATDCESAITALSTFGYLTVGQATTWKVENGMLTLTNGTATQSLPIKQNGDVMTLTVNTNTSGTGAAVNALLMFKRL